MMKEQWKNLLYSWSLSVILFCVVLPQCKVYLMLFDSIWAILLITYGNEKNREFLQLLLCFSIGNAAAFGVMKLLNGGSISGIDGYEMIGIGGAFAEILAAVRIVCRKVQTESEEEEKKIFPGHQYDLDRLKERIVKVSLVGMNAQWGDGKSFLVRSLCKDPDINEKFEMIQIDLLTYNLNEIETILLAELEKIMSRNHIFSKYARKLRRLLGEEKIWGLMQDFFMGNEPAVSTAFLGFRQEVQKLEKKILIIYEDLDRIADADIIKKIFAISEKLSGDKIHILYQYEQTKLDKLGLSREYVEKYIPYVVNLTEITYRDLVKSLWEEMKMQEAEIDQKEVLEIPQFPVRNYGLEKLLDLQMDVSFDLRRPSIRSVKTFLEDVKLVLQENAEYRKVSNRKIVIRLLFVKNFYYQHYEKMSAGRNLEEVLFFEWKDANYTMNQLVNAYKKQEFTKEDLVQLLKDDANVETYAILSLFEYRYLTDADEINLQQETNKIQDELKKREEWEKTNRLIWNLLCNGQSEYTDMQEAIQSFKEIVLAVPSEEQEEAWHRYHQNMFKGKSKKGNRTIFRWGVDRWLMLFQGFRILNESEENWLQLLQCYNNIYSEKTISAEFVKNLTYCDLSKKRVYLQVLQQFCEYEIIGNLNKEPCYINFWNEYFGAVFYLGYSDSYIFEPWHLEVDWKIKNMKEHMLQILDGMEQTLETERENLIYDEIQMEYEWIIRFVQKNRQVLQATQEIHERELKINTKFSSRRKNQQEYDRLLSIQEWDEFCIEVQKSYHQGKISIRDIRELQKIKKMNII